MGNAMGNTSEAPRRGGGASRYFKGQDHKGRWQEGQAAISLLGRVTMVMVKLLRLTPASPI